MLSIVDRLSIRLLEDESVPRFGGSLVMGDAREQPAARPIRPIGGDEPTMQRRLSQGYSPECSREE
jgi:hypothetical protein